MNSQLSFYKNNTGDTLIAGKYKQDDKDIIVFSLAASFLVKRGEYISAGEYANRIAETYSIDDPRTAAVLTTLKSYVKGLSK